LPTKTKSSNRYLGPIVFRLLEEAIDSGDAGMISAAALALKDYDKTYLSRYVSDTLFTTAFDKLDFPKHLEPMQYLADVHNYYFPDNKISMPKTDTRRSYINDNFTKFDATYTAVVETDAGEIQFELLIEHAPETVLNFIDLAEQDFFNDKVFQRVVPNFVIQTGCTRGDGYGGVDFTIRSELSPMRYLEEGYVGMASAGSHTEGSQWFITHSPTPHLSGRYTIFGKVSAGMDVVKKMKVGTEINNVNIVDVPNL
jgi:cyclophilin family peptidyl-prolyl cis-trans isomerase